MKILVLHSSEAKPVEWAKSLQKSLQKLGCPTDLMAGDVEKSTPVGTTGYEVICVVSPFRGLWRPIIPIEIDSLIKRCTRLAGKRGVAIVGHRFGSGKALRFLMHLMEAQGVLVEDFAAVRNERDIDVVAKRISKLVK